MSEVYEHRVVACPYKIAREYLSGDMKELAQSHDPITLTLRAPLAGADVRKDVIVTFARSADPMHFDEPWSVHWTPEGGGPYPDFKGELTVRADEDYTTAILELRGKYQPPGGIVGAAFDRALGTKIASATAKALLAEIAAGMEVRHARDERSKHQKV